MLARLEEQYEAHTARLARLMARPRDRRTALYHVAEIANCRQALAETARALQRMADGDFGRCGLCAGEIPVALLSAHPEARYCSSCEAAIPA
jgi:DnaK suppressor protein